MRLEALFRKPPARAAAERILAGVIAAARDAALYAEPIAAPDTLEGRFETLTVMAALALERLSRDAEGERVAQIFVDRLFRYVDAGLREAGVGDLSVPRRMRALAGDFYGRAGAYAAAAEPAAFAAALGRNIWGREDAPGAAPLARRLLSLRERLARASLPQLEHEGFWSEEAAPEETPV